MKNIDNQILQYNEYFFDSKLTISRVCKKNKLINNFKYTLIKKKKKRKKYQNNISVQLIRIKIHNLLKIQQIPILRFRF